MKQPLFAFLLLPLAVASLYAEDVPVPGYEPAPVLKASEILQQAWLTGAHHKVREEVTSEMGINRFVVESPFGTFVAQGNQMLQERVLEVRALARLREITNTSQFTKGLKEAAKVPLEVAEDLVTSPGETLAAVPKGVGKFLGRVKRGAKEVISGRERGAGEDSTAQQLSGMSKAKRELCAELGVNPYSSNEILQHELDRVARVLTIGKLTVKALTLPVGGAAETALTAAAVVDETVSIACTQSPSDLRALNATKLAAMGISEKDAEAFLAAPAFSPWHQTQMVRALEKMSGIKGRDVLLRDATANSAGETDAVFYQQTAQLIAHAYAAGMKIDRIQLVNGLPVCIGADGGVIVALQWDYALWSPRSERFAGALQEMQVNGAKPASFAVVLTGVVSPRLRQELESRGFSVQDRLLKGPLK